MTNETLITVSNKSWEHFKAKSFFQSIDLPPGRLALSRIAASHWLFSRVWPKWDRLVLQKWHSSPLPILLHTFHVSLHQPQSSTNTLPLLEESATAPLPPGSLFLEPRMTSWSPSCHPLLAYSHRHYDNLQGFPCCLGQNRYLHQCLHQEAILAFRCQQEQKPRPQNHHQILQQSFCFWVGLGSLTRGNSPNCQRASGGIF